MFEYGPSKLEQLKVIIKMILGGENMELFIRRLMPARQIGSPIQQKIYKL